MRILYRGRFFAEGLRRQGHEVVGLKLQRDRRLDELIESSCPDPDLVLVEFFGDTPLPLAMHASRHRLAAYCIDSCINEFWQGPLAALFDHVFVDQLSSVRGLARRGIRSSWLPLCVSEKEFREPRPEEHFLSFVGRVNEFRAKRRNLLKLLSSHFPVNVAQGKNIDEMQDIHAASRVVLNENFFSGLTLRVFQGLASGALVLTERGGTGVDEYFSEGEHLACYGPEDVLDVLGEIRRDPGKWLEVAAAGQRECRLNHTSETRARQMIEALESGKAENPRLGPRERKLAEAEAKYAFSRRFGGAYRESVEMLSRLAAQPTGPGREAAHLLGAVLARRGDHAAAREQLGRAVTGREGFHPACKLAMTFVYEENFEAAVSVLLKALKLLPQSYRDFRGRLLQALKEENPGPALFRVMAGIYLKLGRAFEPGCLKQAPETFPDYALEFALSAWEREPCAEALDLLIACARRAGVEAEIVPQLREAILLGLAEEEQVAYTAEVAKRTYDGELAEVIASALEKKRRHEAKRKARESGKP